MQTMGTETVIIMIVGLVAIGLIRLVIAMAGRQYAADHPNVKGTSQDTTTATQRPVRGTGRKSHLMYFPEAESTPEATPPGQDRHTERGAVGSTTGDR
ncbi:MAG: hypothetical protein ABL971_16785 [Vicinamibacterales bacterium]